MIAAADFPAYISPPLRRVQPQLESHPLYHIKPKLDAYARGTGFGYYMRQPTGNCIGMKQPVQKPGVLSVSVAVPTATGALSVSRIQSNGAPSCRPSSASTGALGVAVQQRPFSAPEQHLRRSQEAPPIPQSRLNVPMVLELGSHKPPPLLQGVRTCGGSHSIAAGTQRQARRMAAVHQAQASGRTEHHPPLHTANGWNQCWMRRSQHAHDIKDVLIGSCMASTSRPTEADASVAAGAAGAAVAGAFSALTIAPIRRVVEAPIGASRPDAWHRATGATTSSATREGRRMLRSTSPDRLPLAPVVTIGPRASTTYEPQLRARNVHDCKLGGVERHRGWGPSGGMTVS